MIASLPTIGVAVQQMRAGKLSPVELLQRCLANLEQWEPQVAAWEFIDREGALKEAQRIEKKWKQGASLEPLAGIPIGIKDIIDVAGWPTKAGSPLRAKHVAESDAVIVRKLRRAGAILLGKTVTTEFASFDPPKTTNPWNAACTPGGSSSGSAAAVATGMCLAAIGTQTGGSVIRPASYCGVHGLKPTYGASSLQGVVPLSPRLDHVGMMARSPLDLWSVLAAIGNPFRIARFSRDFLRPAVETKRSSEKGTQPHYPLMRLAADHLPVVDPGVGHIVTEAMNRLQKGNSTADTVRLPCDLAEIAMHHYRIMAVEAAHVHRDAFEREPHLFGPRISELIQTGLGTQAVDYVESVRHQQGTKRIVDAWLERQKVILMMPATTSVAPTRETTGNPAWNSPWSYLGLPALTIPCGLLNGLPVGLQLVGPRDGDYYVIQAAQQIAMENPLLSSLYPRRVSLA
jgi:Asp-tRNA(Asn)/Glu-tRNA(Gln) amidotransferase A subunit family amidase